MQGDAATYAAIMKHTADFTLMQPFGGKVLHGFDPSPGHLKTVGSFCRNGDFRQEIVQSIVSDDVTVLVTIEHQGHRDWRPGAAGLAAAIARSDKGPAS
jgi:hypothetical protein